MNNLDISDKKIKIAILPSGYPTKSNPISGNFVREQSTVLNSECDIIVIYPYFNPFKKDFQPKIIDSFNDGIREFYIEYSGGIIGKIFNKFVMDRKNNSTRIPSTLEKRHSSKAFEFFNYGPSFQILQIIYSLKILKNNIDIIHAHGIYAGFPGLIVAKILNKPIIVTEHYSGFILQNLSLYQRIFAGLVFNNADKIIIPSYALSEAIKPYSKNQNLKIISNFVDIHCFDNIGDEGREHRELLFVGRLSHVKGIIILIKAFKNIVAIRKDVVLYIAGDGELKKECKDLIERSGLSDNVVLLGYLEKNMVAHYMKKCDFYIQPSRMESFGITIIEAMACGKPIISTNVGGIPELVDKEVGILVPPDSEEELISAILFMLDNYQKYSSEIIRNKILNRFSIEVFKKNILAEYFNLINKK